MTGGLPASRNTAAQERTTPGGMRKNEITDTRAQSLREQVHDIARSPIVIRIGENVGRGCPRPAAVRLAGARIGIDHARAGEQIF